MSESKFQVVGEGEGKAIAKDISPLSLINPGVGKSFVGIACQRSVSSGVASERTCQRLLKAGRLQYE